MIARHRGEYPLSLMCRVLAVSPSGFHAAQSRVPSVRATTDAALRVQIAATHQRARQEYGARGHQQALRATDTGYAPWTIVEGNDKFFARVKVLRTVVDALKKGLGDSR